MSKKEVFPSVPTPSITDIAKKHKVPASYISKQLTKGIKVEKEHTKNAKAASEIALDHLNERPDYYEKLEKVEKAKVSKENLHEISSKLARSYYEKANKDPVSLFSHRKDAEHPFKASKSLIRLKSLMRAKARGGYVPDEVPPDDPNYDWRTGRTTKSKSEPEAEAEKPKRKTRKKAEPFEKYAKAVAKRRSRSKKIAEDITGTSGVSGFGYDGSGPAVDSGSSDYRGTNAMSYLDENGNRLDYIRVAHINHHNKALGFEAFNPKRIGANRNFHTKHKHKLDETITKKTSVGNVIHDFVHSDNKTFSGDSKKKRIKRALGAYYAMHKEETVNELFDTDKGKERGKDYVRKAGLQMYQLGRDDEDDGKRRKNLESNEKMEAKGKDGDKVRKMHKDTMTRLTRNHRMMKNRTKYVPKALDKLVKEEKTKKSGLSQALLTRYYDKAMSQPFSKEHDVAENPKGKHRELNRLKGVNLAAQKGAKTDNLWKVPGDDKPVNSLAKIMRKKVYKYGEEPKKKPTRKEVTGQGVGRLSKAIKNLKGQAWALSYPGRLATPQQREPDMFWQGPLQPDHNEIPKAMAHRQRVLGKIERLTSRLNQYGERGRKSKDFMSPMEIKQSKTFGKIQRVGKDKSDLFKWEPGQKMDSGYSPVKESLEESNAENKRKKKLVILSRRHKTKKKTMSSFDPRRMLAAHNRKAAHNNREHNRVNEAEMPDFARRGVANSRYGRDLVDRYRRSTPLPVKKKEKTMDTKNVISEAVLNILEQNYVTMKENFEAALNAKAVERLDELKKEIASTYFATEE